MASPLRKKLRSTSTIKPLPLKPVLKDGKLLVHMQSRESEAQKHTSLVEFSEPGADEECMITMDNIASYHLDFLPGQTFSLEYPNLKKATLHCGHSFSGMAITWHFMSNNMRCPCCRVGSDLRLSSSCLPSHLKTSMIMKNELDKMAEKAAEERDNLFKAISIFMEGEDVGPSLDMFFSTLNAVLTIYWFDEPDSQCPSVVTEHPLQTSLSGSPQGVTSQSSSETASFLFYLQRHQARLINHTIRDLSSNIYLELVLSTRSATNDVIELDRTHRIHLSNPVSLDILNCKISLLSTPQEDTVGIESIQWSVPREAFAFRLGRALGSMLAEV